MVFYVRFPNLKIIIMTMELENVYFMAHPSGWDMKYTIVHFPYTTKPLQTWGKLFRKTTTPLDYTVTVTTLPGKSGIAHSISPCIAGYGRGVYGR